MDERGLFIVFEGIDCCGKDTQADLLLENFIKKDYYGCIINDPRYVSPIGRCYSEMLGNLNRNTNHNVWLPLALAARVDGIYKQGGTLDMLEKGINIIQTRFNMSGLVYGETAENKHFAEEAFQYINTIIVPDLTIYIDITPEKAMERLSEREGKIVDQFENLESIKKAYDRYQKLILKIEADPVYKEKFVKVNGDNDKYILHTEIVAAVERFCGIDIS